MAQYATLKAAIDAVIKANGQREITGTVLNQTLNAMVNSLGADYQFAGVATPSTNPGTPDQNVFYLAGQGGTYSNFNNIVLPDGVSILMWNGSWSSQTVLAGDGGVFDISEYKATGGTLATFADLSAALDGGNNVPDDVRRGGMQVRFVQTSDNKYVQYRFMLSEFTAAQFANAANWQGVDEEPTANSKNLIESRGVYDKVFHLENIAYSERLENKFISGDGTESTTTVNTYLYKYSIVKNKKYILRSVLKKVGSGSSPISVGLFDSNDLLIKVIYYNPSDDSTLFKYIVDTTGLENVAKLKVCSVQQEEDKPVVNMVVPMNDEMSKFGRLLGYDSIEYNKSIRTSDGSIVESSNSNIYTYSLSDKDKILFIDTDAPNSTWVYSFVALYNNDTLVKIVRASNNTSYNCRFMLNIGDTVCNKLKIVSKSKERVPAVFAPFDYIDYKTINFSDIQGSISSSQLSGIVLSDISGKIGLNQIEDSAVLSTNGYYNVLSPTEELAKNVVKNNGEIGTTTASYCTVQKFALTTDTLIKLHFYKAKMNWNFSEGCLRKNGESILIFPSLNQTVAAVDKVINNRLLGADELWLSVDTSNKDNTIVSLSAVVVDTPTVFTPITDILTMPTPIHVLTHSPEKFGIIQRLYIEGLVKGSESIAKTVTLEGRQNIIVEAVHSQGQEGSYRIPIHVTADGCTEETVYAIMDKININKLKNNTIKLMCIGDSLTQQGYHGVVNFIGKCLNQDYCSGNESIESVTLGVRPFSQTLSLGNYSFPIRSYYEGKAGRAACDHLRHFFTVETTKTAWDLLGLGTMTRNGIVGRTYVNFDVTNQEHLDLISNTCHGWYDVENTEDAFNDLKNTFGITTFTYDGQSYTLGSTYSSDQYPAMVAAFKYILNWGNCAFNYLEKVDFYDYDTVQQTNGDHSFNFSAYLNRFKTLADDGKTRLVPGDTAGSLVRNAELFDVCTPSHVVLIMGVNHELRYKASAQAVVDDIEQIADLIHSYDPTIKIGIGCARMYGALNPYKYESQPGDFYWHEPRIEIWEEEKTRFANSDYAVLPIYAIQSVFGTNGGYGFDSCDLQLRQKMEGDYTHAGTPMAYLAWAYEVVAWVASTYTS